MIFFAPNCTFEFEDDLGSKIGNKNLSRALGSKIEKKKLWANFSKKSTELLNNISRPQTTYENKTNQNDAHNEPIRSSDSEHR